MQTRDAHIPNEFYFPISKDIMHDPVIAEDGHTYERSHIVHWLATHTTSPKTGVTIGSNLIPNFSVKGMISDWAQRFPEQAKELMGDQEEATTQTRIFLLETAGAKTEEKKDHPRKSTGKERRTHRTVLDDDSSSSMGVSKKTKKVLSSDTSSDDTPEEKRDREFEKPRKKTSSWDTPEEKRVL